MKRARRVTAVVSAEVHSPLAGYAGAGGEAMFEERSLRFHVEKWFGRTAISSLEVSRVRPAKLGPNRCVQVVSPQSENRVTIFFFQHGDGRWSVFPPPTRRATPTFANR